MESVSVFRLLGEEDVLVADAGIVFMCVGRYWGRKIREAVVCRKTIDGKKK